MQEIYSLGVQKHELFVYVSYWTEKELAKIPIDWQELMNDTNQLIIIQIVEIEVQFWPLKILTGELKKFWF